MFEASRVRARRGRSPLVLIGWLVLIGGVVAIGLSGRNSGAAAPSHGPVAAAASTGPSETPGATAPFSVPVAPGPGSSTGSSSDLAPIQTSGPGPIQLEARRHPETVFVHGDVFGTRITWVFVSLQDAGGQVVGWASVSVPGAAGVPPASVPSLRFDVELGVPANAASGKLTIQATAYGSGGQLVASVRLALPTANAATAEGAVERGFRPGSHFPLLDATFDPKP